MKTGDEGKNEALASVVNGQATCMLYVAAPGSEFMKQVDSFGEKIKLIPMREDAVLEKKDPAGYPVYAFVDFDGKYYPNLQDRGWTNWTGSVGTYAVPADIVVANAWREKHREEYDDLAGALLDTRDEILEHVAQ